MSILIQQRACVNVTFCYVLIYRKLVFFIPNNKKLPFWMFLYEYELFSYLFANNCAVGIVCVAYNLLLFKCDNLKAMLDVCSLHDKVMF
jgi:hypothetical protein